MQSCTFSVKIIPVALLHLYNAKNRSERAVSGCSLSLNPGFRGAIQTCVETSLEAYGSMLHSILQVPSAVPGQLLEQSNYMLLYPSTNIPAATAWTILLSWGFSSVLLSIIPICHVKVEANQSWTSKGTESDWMSPSSSSVSSKCLEGGGERWVSGLPWRALQRY